jgi:hypothetical protein
VLNVRWAEIDAKFGQVVKPPAALAAVETTPDAPVDSVEHGDGAVRAKSPAAPVDSVEHGDGAVRAKSPAAPVDSVEHGNGAVRAKSPAAPGGPVEHGDDAVRAKSPAAPGGPVELPPTAPGVSVEHGAGGDGTATKVAAKRRRCSKTQCTLPAKDGSTYCERCDVAHAVHLEYLEERSSCFRCKNTVGAYCDRHQAEMNAEIEKRMAKQKNEATADGAGGAKCTAAPGDPVEQGAAVEHVLCYRCVKKPVADDRSDYCNDCIAKLGLA